MKEDQLDSLLKESLIQTSGGFTDNLMEKLVKKQMLKVRNRLYALVAFVIACFGSGAFIVSRFGAELNAFGLSIELPKIGPLVFVSFIGLIVLVHLTNLIKMTSLK